MTPEDVDRLLMGVKTAGAVMIVCGGVFAVTTLDGGFGDDPGSIRSFLVVAGALYCLGWIVLATGLSWHPESPIRAKAVTVWIASGIVSVASFMMFSYRSGNTDVPLVWPFLFCVGWAALAGALAFVRKGAAVEASPKSAVFGVGAALSMSLAALVLLPWEKQACVTEGFGQMFVALGWLLVVNA